MTRRTGEMKMESGNDLTNNLHGAILFPRGGPPFGQHQESRPLGGSNFLSMRRILVSYS